MVSESGQVVNVAVPDRTVTAGGLDTSPCLRGPPWGGASWGGATSLPAAAIVRLGWAGVNGGAAMRHREQ